MNCGEMELKMENIHLIKTWNERRGLGRKPLLL